MAKRRNGDDSAAVRLALADSLRESGDPAAAREEYRKLLASDPSLAQAHFGLGRTLSGAEAELAFRKTLERFPRYGAAQFALAAELRRTGRPSEAAKVLANYEQDKLVTPAWPLTNSPSGKERKGHRAAPTRPSAPSPSNVWATWSWRRCAARGIS